MNYLFAILGGKKTEKIVESEVQSGWNEYM